MWIRLCEPCVEIIRVPRGPLRIERSPQLTYVINGVRFKSFKRDKKMIRKRGHLTHYVRGMLSVHPIGLAILQAETLGPVCRPELPILNRLLVGLPPLLLERPIKGHDLGGAAQSCNVFSKRTRHLH